MVPSPSRETAAGRAALAKDPDSLGSLGMAISCGHGHFDLGAYDAYLQGNLRDFEYPDVKIREALAALPKVE